MENQHIASAFTQVSDISVFVRELQKLQVDLQQLMENEPYSFEFDKVKPIAEEIAKLVSGEIQGRENANIQLNKQDTESLYSNIKTLCDLLTGKDLTKFSEYLAMIEELIKQHGHAS